MRRIGRIPLDVMHPHRRGMTEALRPLKPRADALLIAVSPSVTDDVINELAQADGGSYSEALLHFLHDAVSTCALREPAHYNVFEACRFVLNPIFARKCDDGDLRSAVVVLLAGAIVSILLERGEGRNWSYDFEFRPDCIVAPAIAIGGAAPAAAARSLAAITDSETFYDNESLFLGISACLGIVAADRLPMSVDDLGVLVKSLLSFEAALTADATLPTSAAPAWVVPGDLEILSPLLHRHFGNPRSDTPLQLAEQLKLLALLAA